MRISGLQKLTLLDYPGTVACTVFTAGCNMRCPFCHNSSLVLPERMAEDEISVTELLGFLKKRQGILDGVAISGGEPLLNEDMPELLRDIKALGYKVKLDTNGTKPTLLTQLIEEGLVDRVAMDIKNSPERYPATVGRADFDISPVERSKELLLKGKVEYEFRTTVVKGLHTKDSLRDAARWISGAKEYYLQQFKDSGELILPDGLEAFNDKEMNELKDAVCEFVPAAKLRGL